MSLKNVPAANLNVVNASAYSQGLREGGGCKWSCCVPHLETPLRREEMDPDPSVSPPVFLQHSSGLHHPSLSGGFRDLCCVLITEDKENLQPGVSDRELFAGLSS